MRLLGRFEVRVDSRPVLDSAWPQKRAADLVKLLALAHGHRLTRDQVVEMLWPRLAADAGVANLHKAASYARRALGERDAIVVHGGVVALAPGAEVITDVERFERGDDTAYGGELLPDDAYEQWTQGPRARLRERRLAVLRSRGRWEEVLQEDSADEEAHRALMRRRVERGDRPAAARQFRLLREELARLGAEPSEETRALERELMRGPAIRAPRSCRARSTGASESLRPRRRAPARRRRRRRRAARHRLGRDRQDAHDRGRARRGRAARPPHAPRRRSRGGGPHAVRAPRGGARPARRRGARSWSARSGQRAGSRCRDCCPRCAGRRGWPRSPSTAIASSAPSRSFWRGPPANVGSCWRSMTCSADEATVAVVHHLARSAAGQRLLVVAGMCDEPLPEAAALVRSSLIETRRRHGVALGPLDRRRARARSRSARRADRCRPDARRNRRSAAGNPFFAEELAASVDASGEVTVSAHGCARWSGSGSSRSSR